MTYINFQKIDFVAIGGSCAVFYDEFAHLVPVPKLILRKISVPAGPTRTGGDVVTRDSVISSETAWLPRGNGFSVLRIFLTGRGSASLAHLH